VDRQNRPQVPSRLNTPDVDRTFDGFEDAQRLTRRGARGRQSLHGAPATKHFHSSRRTSAELSHATCRLDAERASPFSGRGPSIVIENLASPEIAAGEWLFALRAAAAERKENRRCGCPDQESRSGHGEVRTAGSPTLARPGRRAPGTQRICPRLVWKGSACSSQSFPRGDISAPRRPYRIGLVQRSRIQTASGIYSAFFASLVSLS